MYTETSEWSELMSVGGEFNEEDVNGSLEGVGGAYSGMVRMSNCDTRETVMLR